MRASRWVTGVLAAVAALATVAPPAVAGAAFGAGTPAFVTSAAPSDNPEADAAGEPSIGLDWRTGAGLFQADALTYRLAFDTRSQPPQVTWTPAPSTWSVYNADPILATDPRSGTTLAGGDDLACGLLSRTVDDGARWSPSVACSAAADHPTVALGPGGAGHEGLVGYYCQQTAVDVCATSTDAGVTWLPAAPINACSGKFGHLKVAPDGTAYLPSVTCTGSSGNVGVGVGVSTDGGRTWSGQVIRGAPTPDRGFDPSVAVTPDGTLYESWSRGGDFHPMVASSKDRGANWTTPRDLAATVGPSPLAATFEAAVAGDDGRVAVAYLGTGVGGGGATPFDSGFHGLWQLYVSTSYDGGATWTTVTAPGGPVQRGLISDGGTASTDHRNLLDFMDAGVTRDGRVVVGFADGCLGVCKGPLGTEAMSLGAHATVALQSAGRGLFRAYDTVRGSRHR